MSAEGKPYFAGGRDGIYFRENIGGASTSGIGKILLAIVVVALALLLIASLAHAVEPSEASPVGVGRRAREAT
jgi:hypothetical protein